MTSKLTEKQAKMVEDNHNLIYTFLYKNGLDNNEIEDWYGVAAIALCKAAATYDENIGTPFSSYAFKVMTNAVKSTARDNSRRSIVPCVSLDEKINPNASDKTFDTLLSKTEGFEDFTLSRSVIVDIFDKLKESDKAIIDLIISHKKSISATAKLLGISRYRASKTYHDFINDAKKALAHS